MRCECGETRNPTALLDAELTLSVPQVAHVLYGRCTGAYRAKVRRLINDRRLMVMWETSRSPRIVTASVTALLHGAAA
jgi:hypothetical protein